jgi:hypothetical protein
MAEFSDILSISPKIMGQTLQSASIHTLAIATTGGTPARQGFNLQDHVGAGFCVRMLIDAALKEVWCEAHDDLTVIWDRTSGEEVEFVQVKGEEPNQLWSVALLCQPDGKSKAKSGTSILERSLGQHKCTEPCWFRLVTSRDVMDDLRGLTHPVGSPERAASKGALDSLSQAVSSKVNGFQSPNGKGVDFWVERAHWEVVHAVEAVSDRNRLSLSAALESRGVFLLGDQIAELYKKIVKQVFDASLSAIAEGKKLRSEAVLKSILDNAEALVHPPPVGGTRITEKMTAAELTVETIETAKQTRWLYRQRVLRDQYASPSEHRLVEGEVVARLNTLLNRLDTGELLDDGPTFHLRCQNSLAELYEADATAKKLGLSFLHGYMYNITDRCVHRFLRVSA